VSAGGPWQRLRGVVERLRGPIPSSAEVEIHVPISPTPNFFTMVHYLAASLRLNGGALAASPIVVTVGEDCEPEDLHRALPWSRRYPIEWRWLPRDLYRRHIYYATALERFRLPFRAPTVMMLDADVFCTGGFDELVARTRAERSIAGLVAHVSPFKGLAGRSAPELWAAIFASAGLGAPPFTCEHTGWPDAPGGPAELGEQRCPPYFNLGMLVAPAEVMQAIGDVIYDEMAAVDRVLETHFRCQLALSLAIVRLGIPWHAVAMRFNYPNDEPIASHYREDLADVRLFHYLRVAALDKSRDFANPDAVGAMLARSDLDGVNREMARRLRPVHEAVLADRG
jgi:hypothetical protein